jgi:hypothetical protein
MFLTFYRAVGTIKEGKSTNLLDVRHERFRKKDFKSRNEMDSRASACRRTAAVLQREGEKPKGIKI